MQLVRLLRLSRGKRQQPWLRRLGKSNPVGSCSGSLHFLNQKDGHRFHTRTIEFGQEVGFVAMIALVRRQGTAIANRDSLLLEIDSALFSELHEAHPADFGLMTLNLARDMARQICRLGDLLVEHSISY